jgi:hypothetical protein
MAIFSRPSGSHNIHPDVRLDGRHRLILFDDWAEHWLFIPSLAAVLRRYLESPQSREWVRQWIGEIDAGSPSGFVRLCEYLDLDVDYVRGGLTRWMDDVDRGQLAAICKSRTGDPRVLGPSEDGQRTLKIPLRVAGLSDPVLNE